MYGEVVTEVWKINKNKFKKKSFSRFFQTFDIVLDR